MIYIRFNGYGQWRFYEDDVDYRSIPNGQDSYYTKGIFSLTDDDEDDIDWDEENLKNLGSINLNNHGINMLRPSDHPKSAYSKMVRKGKFDSLLIKHSDSDFFKREHRGEFGDDPEEAEDNGDHDKAAQLRRESEKAWHLHEEAQAAEYHELAKVANFHIHTKREYKLKIVKPYKLDNIEAPFSETERNKMLTLIIGMAIDAYLYEPTETRNEASGEKKNSISEKLKGNKIYDISISNDTIHKYLTAAKELLKRKNE